MVFLWRTPGTGKLNICTTITLLKKDTAPKLSHKISEARFSSPRGCLRMVSHHLLKENLLFFICCNSPRFHVFPDTVGSLWVNLMWTKTKSKWLGIVSSAVTELPPDVANWPAGTRGAGVKEKLRLTHTTHKAIFRRLPHSCTVLLHHIARHYLCVYVFSDAWLRRQTKLKSEPTLKKGLNCFNITAYNTALITACGLFTYYHRHMSRLDDTVALT